ncbi:MAG: hypothetical protein U0T74_09235 [Chitinophagales bacterium]
MAKQTNKQTGNTTTKKSGSTDFNAVSYVLRNLLVTAVIGFLFLTIYKMNEKQGQLPELYQEFSQLRQSGVNQERQQELYNQIMTIQSDTSFFKSITRGYYWAIHDLAIKNLEQINEMKDKIESGQMKPLSREDKLGYKVGVYPLLKYVNDNTPKDAVILLPPGDSAISNNSKWNFIYNPEWVEYFIYPRLCLTTGHEDEHPDLAKRITHVLIIEGKGYDKLKYDVPVEQRASEAVLPINSPPASTQSK